MKSPHFLSIRLVIDTFCKKKFFIRHLRNSGKSSLTDTYHILGHHLYQTDKLTDSSRFTVQIVHSTKKKKNEYYINNVDWSRSSEKRSFYSREYLFIYSRKVFPSHVFRDVFRHFEPIGFLNTWTISIPLLDNWLLLQIKKCFANNSGKIHRFHNLTNNNHCHKSDIGAVDRL